MTIGDGLGRKVLRDRSRSRSRAVRLTVTAVIVLLASTVTRAASAFCRTTTCPSCDHDEHDCPTGLPINWPTSCATFAMQYRASRQVDLGTATTVMEKAFAVWQEVSCPEGGGPPSIHVDHVFGNASCNLHEYNQTDGNANIILFRDDEWPYDDAGNVLGLTTVTYSRRTGTIFDVDMEINGTQHLSVEDPVPKTAYDLQSIVTHEAGHFLGLAHSTDPSATMWPRYSSGAENFRVLGADDAAGICAIFPPRVEPPCDATPRQGFSPECGIFPSGEGGHCSFARPGQAETGDQGRGWLGLAGAFLAIGVMRRRGPIET